MLWAPILKLLILRLARLSAALPHIECRMHCVEAVVDWLLGKPNAEDMDGAAASSTLHSLIGTTRRLTIANAGIPLVDIYLNRQRPVSLGL